ncbi:MAG: hypothetical protein RM338_22380 [Nostoc sp. DedQUE12a]|nr:hypothetical protein [Nostoc sp. DedQUE12a]
MISPTDFSFYVAIVIPWQESDRHRLIPKLVYQNAHHNQQPICV